MPYKIDLTTEDLIPIGELPKHLPTRVHFSTIHRWRLRGIAGIKLPSICVGRERFTSREALNWWFAETTAAKDGNRRDAMRAGRMSAQRERAIEAAEREVDEAGI